MIIEWFARYDAFRKRIDREAALLIEQDGENAIFTASRRAMLANAMDDFDAERLWTRVKRRIASMSRPDTAATNLIG